MKETEEKKKKGEIKLKMKNYKGITLIALVVTIVVLLILASVSIAMLGGENGIIVKAKEAVEDTKDKADKEQTIVNGRINMNGVWYDSIEDYINGKISNNQENIEKTVSRYKELGTFADEETILEDDEKNTVVLPEKFKIAKESTTIVNDGVVIEDEDGNQYVWVPVTQDAEGGNTVPYSETGALADGTEIKLSRYAFNSEGVATDKGKNSITIFDYFAGSGTPTWVAEETTNSTIRAVAKNLEDFKESVAENGGYYVARYEASFNAQTEKASSKITAVHEGDGRLLNKVTQLEAAELCQNLYLNVKSDLMNSYAWDTAIVYIQKCSENSSYSIETSKNASLSNTGTNNDEVCKINDLASNLSEWTTEQVMTIKGYLEGYCEMGVYRGGKYTSFDNYSKAASRDWNDDSSLPTEGAENIGFRSILYI